METFKHSDVGVNAHIHVIGLGHSTSRITKLSGCGTLVVPGIPMKVNDLTVVLGWEMELVDHGVGCENNEPVVVIDTTMYRLYDRVHVRCPGYDWQEVGIFPDTHGVPHVFVDYPFFELRHEPSIDITVLYTGEKYKKVDPNDELDDKIDSFKKQIAEFGKVDIKITPQFDNPLDQLFFDIFGEPLTGKKPCNCLVCKIKRGDLKPVNKKPEVDKSYHGINAFTKAKKAADTATKAINDFNAAVAEIKFEE